MPQSSWWQCQEDLQNPKQNTTTQRKVRKSKIAHESVFKSNQHCFLWGICSHVPFRTTQATSVHKACDRNDLEIWNLSMFAHQSWQWYGNTAWISMILHNNDANNETERKWTRKRTKLSTKRGNGWNSTISSSILILRHDVDRIHVMLHQNAWISATDKSRLPISKVRMTSPSGHGENNKHMFINEIGLYQTIPNSSVSAFKKVKAIVWICCQVPKHFENKIFKESLALGPPGGSKGVKSKVQCHANRIHFNAHISLGFSLHTLKSFR